MIRNNAAFAWCLRSGNEGGWMFSPASLLKRVKLRVCKVPVGVVLVGEPKV